MRVLPLALLLAAAGLTFAVPVKRAAGCSKYTIIDTRGTGEPQGESFGFRTMNQAILTQVDGGDQYHTVYSADFSQNSTVATTDIVTQVKSRVDQDARHCIVLQGWSQGSSATVNAMPALTDKYFDAVKAVFLIGSPQHKPNLACNVDPIGGNSTAGAFGLAANRTAGIPTTWVAKTLDVCLYGDGVCDAASGVLITPQHLSYPLSAPTQALGAAFIAKQLQRA